MLQSDSGSFELMSYRSTNEDVTVTIQRLRLDFSHVQRGHTLQVQLSSTGSARYCNHIQNMT